MKVVSIQLQPARSPGLDASAVVARLRALASGAWIDEGEDAGAYVNISFKCTEPTELWRRSAISYGRTLRWPRLPSWSARARTAETITCCSITSTRRSRWTRWVNGWLAQCRCRACLARVSRLLSAIIREHMVGATNGTV
jgi:hypothetical protein